ncbi:gamma-glutamylcyclotransferase [Thalassobaculum sp.]|uniref:gamma-glutamylcyclotransferase n=1 Tax=Thalassobaculum sp. TaxID=2022740 RepID=UPI003B59CC1D
MADAPIPDVPPPSDAPETVALTRERLRSGEIRALLHKHEPTIKTLSDEELAASQAAMFPPTGKPQGDVWLFGYGSLIWNPAIEFAEQRCATVRGLHRRFCLRTELGRGTPDQPGLVLGLDRGGVCRGVAFRIPREHAETELEIVWRREMVTYAYRPRWLKAQTDQGPIDVLGFVINRSSERYCGQLPEDEAADTIAKACGFLGPCCEYLFNTVSHLRELGMPDAGLERLAGKVAARQATGAIQPGATQPGLDARRRSA